MPFDLNSPVILGLIVVAILLIVVLIISSVMRMRRSQRDTKPLKPDIIMPDLLNTSQPRDADLRQRVNTLLEQSDQQISQLRAAKDISSLYDMRNSLLQRLLVDACALAHASHGRIFRTLNAYHKSTGLLDDEYGYLTELIVAPQPLPAGEDPRYFVIGHLSPETHKLFPTQQSDLGATTSELNKYIFNAQSAKPTDPFLDTTSRSGILIPLFEGLNVVGLLSLESSGDSNFSTEDDTLIDACEQIAWMASDIIASTKARLEDFQSATLVSVYQDIMYMKRPDIDEFMVKILEVATRLTARTCEWAQVLLIRSYPFDQDPNIQRVEKSYTLRLSGGNQEDWKISSAEGLNFEEDYPRVTYGAFTRVIEHQSSHLNVDVQADQDWKGRPDIPWPSARSFICMPLIRPLDDLGDKAERVFGLLSLATSRPCMFNDSDDRVLTDFTRAVPLGIRNIELLEEASGLVGSIQHGLGKAVIPLYEEITKEPSAWDALKVRNLASLTRDLMRWFFELANEDDDLDDSDDIEPTSAEEILDGLREPMEILASVTSKKELIFQTGSARPLTILSGRQRGRYLRAALFLYIENAFKYDPEHNIEVTTSYEEDEGVPYVRFDVISRGLPIPEAQRPMLFKRGFRASLTKDGEGIGLYQVRRISVHLGGMAGYRFESPDRNVFFIRMPWVSGVIQE